MIRRHYIEVADVSGSTEAQVALAESLIDQYVGPQLQFTRSQTPMVLTAISNANLTIADTSAQTLLQTGQTDYFAKMHIEVIGGTGVGQIGYIVGHDPIARTITLKDAFTTTPDTTSVFMIKQIAKFPRRQDYTNWPNGVRYYKQIPRAVIEACIVQTQFVIAKGDEFFASDGLDVTSESFLNYSYTKATGANGATQSPLIQMTAPQARILLRGIYNRKGNLRPGVADVNY